MDTELATLTMNLLFEYGNIMHALFLAVLLLGATIVQAQPQATHRVDQFSNDKVKVWKTIIYPASGQVLPMHRHDHDRVLVALSDGLLKITNDKGAVHYLKLEKNKAYYLTKDLPNELHNDENMSKHAVKVMVVELN